MHKFLACFLLVSMVAVSGDRRNPLAAVTDHSPAASTQREAAPSPGVRKESARLDLQELEGFITATMKDQKLPGLSIAVVRDGQVIFAKGFGFRDLNGNLPVTTKTIFPIGSATKSFTALALGILNDEGKLDWDKPVREYLPEFQLADLVATERATPRDLMAHRTGLPRHDLVWYSSDASRKELFDRLRYLPDGDNFRSAMQYNNLMVMTAGYLAGQLSGVGWEEFVRQRILLPLDMTATNFSDAESEKTADYSKPYRKVKDEVKEIPFHELNAIGPAGSINSSIEDMAHYVIFQLSKGSYGGKQIVSENNLVQMHRPQITMSYPFQYQEIGDVSYGLGWVVTSYRGHSYVWHNGGIDGFYALVSLLPQENVGVVILTNMDNGDRIPELVTYHIFDQMLGLNQVPWTERFKEEAEKQKQHGEDKNSQQERKMGTHPSHDLKDYVGRYENPGYGIVKIELNNGSLRLSLNKLSAPLQHFNYDVFEVPADPLNALEKLKFKFNSNLNGDIESISAVLEPATKEIVFTRAPENLSLSVLKTLVGEYDLEGDTLTVSLKGDKLFLMIPGQPEYELHPYKELSFNIKGMNGFIIEFKRDASGKITGFISHQPDGVSEARKK